MMINAFSIGSSGLKAAQIGIDVTSHNVANVHTDGYKRQVVDFDEVARATYSPADFGGMGVVVADINTSTDPFLDRILNDYANKLGLNNEALDGLKQLNDILDKNNIIGSSQEVLNAFQDVANNPTSIPIRENLMSKLSSFASTAKNLDVSLNDFNKYLDEKAKSTIDSTNSLLHSIADVKKLSSNTGDTTAVDSKLNSLLSQLADKVSFTVASNGDIVGENGKVLIQNGTVNELTTADIPLMKDGVLGGLNVVKGVTTDIQTQLPGAVSFFTNEINTIHKQGYDINGTQGLDVFKPFTTLSDLELNITSPNQIAASTDINPKINDGTNTQNISDLRYKLFSNQSVFEKMNDLSRKVGNLMDQYGNAADASNSLFNNLKNNNLSNVNLDEEAVNLMKYQRMYEANAKVIQTANEMLGTLLDIKA